MIPGLMQLPSRPVYCSQKKRTGQHWNTKRKKKYKLIIAVTTMTSQMTPLCVLVTAIRNKKIPMLNFKNMVHMT